jgi:16S rRNA (cytidine1402-2'-O)-methyltransferase
VAGILYIVATPLGNLDDLSPRAVQTLRSVSCIACEDTRRTARVLDRFGIETRTISCHKFNERERLRPVLAVLREGGDVALVTDGGTPALSDPGTLLVREAVAEGFPVSPVPGPSAVAALLSASGLPADRFLFDGFLPHRPGERRKRLRELRDERRTAVLFEAPHRIREALADIAAVLGDRPIVLGRELTKVHETILRGTAEQILEALGDGDVKGEITLAVSGARAGPETTPDEQNAGRILEAWGRALSEAGGNRREALRRSARELGMKRAELQRWLDELGEHR